MTSYHKNTVFSGKLNEPFLSFRMYNRGATTLSLGEVVCFWNNTTTTDRLWCRAVSKGDTMPGSGAVHTNPEYKVAGIVYGGTISQDQSGIIVWGGMVSAKVTSTFIANSLMKLSSVKGITTETISAGDIGKGQLYGIGARSPSGGLANCFITPWRM